MAEWLRRALLAPQESGGPGSNPGADTEDQTVKLAAISIQWVTAGEYCEVNRRSEKTGPDLRQNVEFIHTAGSGSWNGDERHTYGLSPTGFAQRASPMELTLLYLSNVSHLFVSG